MTIAVKRACDACHRRKVKCDGVNPCRNCLGSQLSCTYNAIPQKKGPKGSRAKVINELKEKERQTSLSAKVQNRMNGINGAPSSPSLAPTPGLLQSDIVKSCIDFFFAHMYRAMPILDRARLEQQALYMDQTLDTYCLLTSLCAFVLLQPGMTLPNSDPFSLDSMPGGNLVTSTLLVEETVRVRKGYDYMDSPTLNSLCTSYFLYGCHYGLDLQDKAWFHIREATTLIHMIGMNKEQNYLQYDSVEAAKRRRLYWLLFATERAYALKRGRPLSLQNCINLPTSTDDPTDPAPVHFHAFITQINTFRPYDDSLVNIWNKAKDETSPTYLAAMQKQLQNDLPGYLNDTQAQLGELQLNQSWLKDMAWQLSMANPNEGESGLPPYPTPVDIGRDLLPMVSHLPGNLGLPGLRLVEKLFAVASTLTEILAMQPTSRPYITGPRERLHQILNVLTLIRYGHHSYLPLLLSKVQEAVPTLANPMLQNAPEPVLPTCDMDIFDGFGNAGIGQGSCYTASDYDNKYSAPRMDEMSTESESPMAGHSNHDVSSPFSSSAIMSPSVEMPPHGLPANFNTMQDMMSPMGRPPASVFGNPSPINNPQPQQPPISTYPNLNSQGQGMDVNNLNSPPNTNLPPQGHRSHSHGGSLGHGGGLGNGLGRPGGNNGLMSRPQPQRTNSFAMGAPLGGFHHPLQRVNSDMVSMGSIGISPLGRDMDFNTLPR